MRFDRTDNVKQHLATAAQRLREAAEELERDINRITNINEAEEVACRAISQVGFVAANTMAAISTANHWANEHRQVEVYELKDDANKLVEQIDHLKGNIE
jgi:hypothetical protein